MALFGRKEPSPKDASTAAPPERAPEAKSPASAGTSRTHAGAPIGAGPHVRSAMARIGETVLLDGTLSADEDLQIDGQVKGDITLPEHTLIIGEQGRIEATVRARRVHVLGRIKGDVSASDGIEIEATGQIEGDICAPSLLIREGAIINGAIDMGSRSADSTPKPPPKPGSQARPPRSEPLPEADSSARSSAPLPRQQELAPAPAKPTAPHDPS